MSEADRTENYRRNPRAFTCTRRGFLPVLLREAVVALGMLRGGEGGRLSELASLPDEQLAKIKPLLNPAYEIQVEDEQVLARHKDTGLTVPMFATDEREALMAFDLFDGQHTIEQAGALLSGHMEWDKEAGFAYARDLFLRLVEDVVCVPKDPPRLAEPTS